MKSNGKRSKTVKQKSDMKYSEETERVIGLAKQEAGGRNKLCVGTGDVLLGILLGGTGLVGAILRTHGVNVAKVRRELEKISPSEPKPKKSAGISKTPGLRFAIALAQKEATVLGDKEIGLIHLFLGAMGVHGTDALVILGNLGAEPSELRAAVIGSYQVEKRKQQAP